MNSDIQLEDPALEVAREAGSRTRVAVFRDRTKTNENVPNWNFYEPATVVEARRVPMRNHARPPIPIRTPGDVPQGKPVTKEPAAPRLNARQLAFRSVRLVLAGALVSFAARYARTAITTASSEQAYINAEITALRAPIAGQVRLDLSGSGRAIRAGEVLFRVENARFGNEQAVSQLNFVSELADRLQAESEEAALRLERQEEVTQLHEKMFAEQILPRLEMIEERSKLALARTILTNKLALAKKAAERVAELTRQVELQQSAVVTMPFDGVAWTIRARDGAQLAQNETAVEVINPRRIWVDAFFHDRHADKLSVGTDVSVETQSGEVLSRGRVESVRAGVGRIPFDGVAAVSAADNAPRRIAVRVRLESKTPFEANEFLGVGRNVVVKVTRP